ncbi:hypothetical protein BDW22DRAFT_917377 [Trametopsis cervina]|nr:hypothetical protein BDW22DRAFT_917377 [Trametopsis cervina]
MFSVLRRSDLSPAFLCNLHTAAGAWRPRTSAKRTRSFINVRSPGHMGLAYTECGRCSRDGGEAGRGCVGTSAFRCFCARFSRTRIVRGLLHFTLEGFCVCLALVRLWCRRRG